MDNPFPPLDSYLRVLEGWPEPPLEPLGREEEDDREIDLKLPTWNGEE